MFKDVNLLVLIGGVVVGLSLGSLFNGHGHAVPSPKSNIKSLVIEKEAAVKEAVFAKKLDSLQTSGRRLATVLKTTEVQLTQAKKKNRLLQAQVYDLIDHQRAATARADTPAAMADCDSLQTKVSELIVSSNEKDSLYERATTNLLQQLHNKDSTIAIQSAAYQSLKTSFAGSIAAQKQLAGENRALRKTIRRQKFRNTLRTIGFALLSAATAHFLGR